MNIHVQVYCRVSYSDMHHTFVVNTCTSPMKNKIQILYFIVYTKFVYCILYFVFCIFLYIFVYTNFVYKIQILI